MAILSTYFYFTSIYQLKGKLNGLSQFSFIEMSVPFFSITAHHKLSLCAAEFMLHAQLCEHCITCIVGHVEVV